MEKGKILQCNYRKITSPPCASSPPLSVGVEYFTPEHHMDIKSELHSTLIIAGY